MIKNNNIPIFNLFGETSSFPDIIHCERIWDRARLHDWQISPHRHADMVQVFWMEHGYAQVQIDGQEFDLNDQEFLYIPAQAVHGLSFRQGAEGMVFSFPATQTIELKKSSDALAQRLSQPIRSTVSQSIQFLFTHLAQTFRSTGTFRAIHLSNLAKVTLIELAELAQSAEDQIRPLAQKHLLEFQRMVRANSSPHWDVEQFAQALSITPGHLSRICRAGTGRSAAQYIELARITEASRMLAFTKLSVAEIGYRLGFDDPSYFSRRYRIVTGDTPSEYRTRFS